MARQLLQDRTAAAYAGVESFARRHAVDDAGSLAWLVVGYAHTLDHDYAKGIDPLSRAKPHAGDLGDYVSYYLGTCYLQTNKAAEAVAELSGFDKTYPASLLLRDAHVVYASALTSDGRAQDAVAVLQNDRDPLRSDLELALAKAYEGAGQNGQASTILQNIYFTMPLSAEAPQAEAELQKITPSVVLSPSLEQRKTRADLLMKGKRYSDAVSEYRAIESQAAISEKPQYQLDLAEALRHAGQSREAQRILESVPAASVEIEARRLFNLGEIDRAANNDDAFFQNLAQLRQAAPTSTWLQQELLFAGNTYLIRKDYDHAIDLFRELQQRFPEGDRAPYAHWKATWLSLRQGRTEEAKKGFEEQLALYPNSGEVPAALYWRGRLAEEDHDAPMARAYYEKISERFRNFYYGELARQRLKQLPAGTAPHYALLDHVPPINLNGKISADSPPADDLRVQKAHLLENGALLDFAQRELKAAAEQDKGSWLAPEVARMYSDAGRYDLAIQTLKRAQPNYFAVDLPALPRSYWEPLFPKAYWVDLKRYSVAHELDPYLVASLIRQESEFNPNAVSRANAVGLMQLLPKVGRSMAKQEQIRHFTTSELLEPGVNLRLGTRYFRAMIDEFGSFEYALAAYNAGDNRVREWMGDGKYRDLDEFVESIPFTETREYVQAIMRNANVYRQLYGAP
jgi:soluble lytic murein transglycosylase